MAKRRFRETWRVWAVVAAIVVGFVVVIGRLAQLQILEHDQYAEQARDIHYGVETLTDRRGAILDRNGYPLAASEAAYNVMVEKRAWTDAATAQAAAAELAEITGVSANEMVETVAQTEVFEIPVARGLHYQQAVGVRALGLSGVRLLESSRRVYPEGNLAAQLLGFVGQDNNGLTGLETDLDSILGGNPGSVTYERDGLGRQLAYGERSEIPAQPGANVVLTVDRYIQRLAEQELDKAIQDHEAAGGTIIVVKPETGEVLAMASRPTFDVTQPLVDDGSKQALYRNRAITDTYEPGSVFKLITASAAIDLGLVSPGTWWNDTGVVHLSDWSIYNWDYSANGSQTVQQLLSKSLNTGAAWLASLCGPQSFYDYIARFGFGMTTDSGLSGEVEGRVRTPKTDAEGWSAVDMATNSFGQGIAVTPLQMAMAVAAIANDGQLMKPQFVKEIIGPLSRSEVEPEVVRQVMSPESARTMLDMMGVVVDGYTTVDVPGYEVGGKTGTANIATENGGYKPDAYISSFAGVAPLEDPQIAVLVKIDEPKDVPWGTVVAAPAFNRLAHQALAYMNVPPTEEALVASVDN
ncbi:MAG TPA: penicillin-binding protein 2 [Dehalococcoidia bacterium]|nr:penicillin-binding protein 2 [Dehalococcoidia bacterium]